MSTDTKFTEMWPRQFATEMRKRRDRALESLGAIQNLDGEYANGHRRMIDIYDAAIRAAEVTP